MEFRLHRIALSRLLLLPVALLAENPAPPPAAAPPAFAPPADPAAPPLGVMRHASLQDSRPYEIGIGALPTTILMPDVIEAFEGNNITTQANTVAPVFLQHRDGTRYFSVKALQPGTADLNVLLQGALYSFRFTTTGTPVRTLTIAPLPAGRAAPAAAATPRRAITVRRLYDLLQEAKTYPLVQAQHPELVRDLQASAPGKVIEYPGYRVVLDRICRFDRDDTLVLRVVFLNDNPQPRHYRPGDVGLRVGRNLYWPSFAQLPGVIPPRTPAELAWVAGPEVVALTLINPAGQQAEVTPRVSALLSEPGPYTLRAELKHGRVETVSFVVRFPAPPAEAEPGALRLEPGARGLRQVTLRQPQPGQNFGYVCYTGTADGQRADLSLENDFSLVVPATLRP